MQVGLGGSRARKQRYKYDYSIEGRSAVEQGDKGNNDNIDRVGKQEPMVRMLTIDIY